MAERRNSADYNSADYKRADHKSADHESADRNRAATARAPRERHPRSFWFDPRFAIGLGLVIASVVGVYAIVVGTDTTVAVYAASSQLSPGDHVLASDLTTARVRLGEASGNYLGPSDVPSAGVVVTREVAAGELVPRTAVGDVSSLRVASVVVTIAGQLPQSVGPGSVVDVWSAEEGDRSVFGPPSVLVGSATVVRIAETSGLISERGKSVEVLVPRDKVARVLEAVANGDAVSLVPVSIPVGR